MNFEVPDIHFQLGYKTSHEIKVVCIVMNMLEMLSPPPRALCGRGHVPCECVNTRRSGTVVQADRPLSLPPLPAEPRPDQGAGKRANAAPKGIESVAGRQFSSLMVCPAAGRRRTLPRPLL